MLDTISPKDYDIAAQFAHFFSAFGLVFAIAVFFGAKWLVIAALGMLAYSAVKEFWWDAFHENSLTRGSSPKDFLFYCLGNFTAIVLSSVYIIHFHK